MVPVPVRVRRVRRQTRDTWTLELEPGCPLERFTFAAGQFNMLYAFGIGEIPVSISSDPAGKELLAHTIRAVGAVSGALCRLKPGSMLGLRGPFGTPWPVEAAEGSDVVVVAGGLGLAPLRPAICRLLASRERYGRVVLLCGARTPADLLFRQDLERWRGQFDVEVEITVDAAPPGWRGDVGMVTTLLSREPFDPPHTVAMLCGPEVMMRFTAMALLERGVPAESIFLSMERNMKCAVGFCGHCQYGPSFICKDGPVFRYKQIEPLLRIREV
jgi:NAD(P)H-flavin reductase